MTQLRKSVKFWPQIRGVLVKNEAEVKRVEFAALAQISPAMVTKYAEQGLLVFVDDRQKILDARASLEALAGRLDEEKRRAALEKVDAAARIAANDSSPAAAPPAPLARSAKQELDELKRDAQALDLARRAGELIPIADVEAAIVDAVTGLQAAFDAEAREMAQQLTIDLNLSPDRTAMLQRRLRTLCNRARNRFAGEMNRLAGAETEAAEATDAGETAGEASG